MNRFASTVSGMIGKARLLCALMVLLAFSSAVIPLGTTSAAASTCALACCSGKAPHAAGSCAHGSCHAAVRRHRPTSHHSRSTTSPTDQLCRLPRRIETKSSARIRPARKTSENDADQTSQSLTSLSRPCLPECGSCSTSFPNSNQRNASALSHERRPGALSNVRLAGLDCSSSKILEALSEQCAPRGPPVTFI